MLRVSWTIAALVVALAVPRAAGTSAPPRRPSVLVRPAPAAGGVDPSVAEALSEVFTEHLARSDAFRSVLSLRDVVAMLRHEQDRQLLGCDAAATSCLAEIGGVMGAEQLALVEVQKLGTAHLLGVRLIDLATASVRFRQTGTLASLEGAVPVVQELAQKLANAARADAAGAKDAETEALAAAAKAAEAKGEAAAKARAAAEAEAAAAKKARAVALSASRPEMVLVPAGKFFYGCNPQVDRECLENEKPGRTVELDAFKIDLREVTLGEYEACVREGGCEEPGRGDGCLYGQWLVGGKAMNCVSWNDALAYCAWRGKRLPTAREWEKAARGADGRRFPWGNEAPTAEHAVLAPEADEVVDTGARPAGASPYGALDMAGNVAEWTSSTYDAVRYEFRGGGWLSEPKYARASDRHRAEAKARRTDLGFRCAL